MKKASKKLVQIARAAARAHGKANVLNAKWVAAFQKEYGHDDISDILVDAIDYSMGEVDAITADFITEHSEPGMS